MSKRTLQNKTRRNLRIVWKKIAFTFSLFWNRKFKLFKMIAWFCSDNECIKWLNFFPLLCLSPWGAMLAIYEHEAYLLHNMSLGSVATQGASPGHVPASPGSCSSWTDRNIIFNTAPICSPEFSSIHHGSKELVVGIWPCGPRIGEARHPELCLCRRVRTNEQRSFKDLERGQVSLILLCGKGLILPV